MTATNDRLLIILSTGKQDHGAKATLAFAFACSALSMGSEVALYVTMDGTIWGLKESTRGIQLPGFDSLETYVEQFEELGGKIFVCPPCMEYYCSISEDDAKKGMRDGAKITGMATAYHFISDHGRVVTF